MPLQPDITLKQGLHKNVKIVWIESHFKQKVSDLFPKKITEDSRIIQRKFDDEYFNIGFKIGLNPQIMTDIIR